jgi:predicted lipid-binding transport protein (Tim44 family)
MSADKIPVTLVLLGMVALFLVLRLRSILGTRQGVEGSPAGSARRAPPPVIDAKAEAPATPARILPVPDSPAGEALAAMQKLDKNFNPSVFLTGAEGAFRLIVTAFAAGDRDKLRPLLMPHAFAAFEQAIAAREAAGETQRSEIRGILEATIEAAALDGSIATITVRFVSHQIAVTTAADGSIVTGADAVTELADVWEFQRDLKDRAPAWRLVSAHSA